MKEYDHIIIGFGKGGKTLAGALAKSGQKVALVEQSDKMYGGTCINVACIPTKTLEYSARMSAVQGGDFAQKAERYQQAVAEKRALIGKLRKKNYDAAVNQGVDVLLGKAELLGGRRVGVHLADGTETELIGGQIYLNTGARPFIPPIPGLKESRFIYTSETMMERDELPQELVIIGGGYIGLEFASYYANFGSQVTVVQDGDFLPREDREMADAVFKSLEERGIRIITGAAVQSVRDEGNGVIVTIDVDGTQKNLAANAILVATGRRPNVEGLHVEAAGIELTQRGAVKVNEKLQTTVPGIWAMGDVKGGLQFTYISLDDSRIISGQLKGDDTRTTENRGNVPYSVFLDPPFSRVGLTEEQAKQEGYTVKIARLPAASVPKAHILRKTTGLLKAIVDAKTEQILGVHLYCAQSHELINLVKLAMDAKLTYTVLKNNIYTHPTMTEAFNALFGVLK